METTLLEEIDIRLERDPPSTEKLYVMEGNGTKRKDIERACQERDITSLVAHASSKGGFLEDELRRVAWPILLGYRSENVSETGEQDWHRLPAHRDEDQVKLDVDRSFVYYPEGPRSELDTKKKELSDLITHVLRSHSMLCYFQGYHDIAQVLLLALGPQQAVLALTRVSLFRIRDYMLPSLSPAVKHLHLIPALLEMADPKLRRHLAGTEPFFALAATLTLYAHDIQEYGQIVRLYDFLLAHEPTVSIYLFGAIILSRKRELMEIPLDEPEMIHFTLSKLPQPLDLEAHISHALKLFEQHAPETLPFRVWQHIPSQSVLKTSRDLSVASTTEEAKKYFVLQTQQLRREERRKKMYALAWHYRRPAVSVTLAVVVGLLSIWLRRNGYGAQLWSLCVGRIKRIFR